MSSSSDWYVVKRSKFRFIFTLKFAIKKCWVNVRSFFSLFSFEFFSDGRHESVHFDKITSRINRLSYNLDPTHVQPVSEKFFKEVFLPMSYVVLGTSN